MFKSGKQFPLKWIFRIGSGDSIDMKNVSKEKVTGYEVPVIGGNGLMGYTDFTNTKENTLIIGRVGAHCGNIHYIEESSWVTDNALRIILTTDKVNQSFLKYSLIALDLNQFANRNAQPLITGEIVKSKKILLVSNQEQTQIVQFLDKKTSQIDKLIEQKEKLLKLLTEKRTALITQAVTKGLDPTVEMKDSGVDWLGEIPKHWEVKRLRFLVKTNPSKSEIKLKNDEVVSFVPMESVQEYGGILLEHEKEISEVYNGYTYFANCDVVVAKITPCFENGKGSIAANLKNDIAFGTTELHVLRTKTHMDHEYLFYITISDSFRKIGESWMYGAGGQKRIPEIFLKDLIIPICDLEEQKNIVNRLRVKVDGINSISEKIGISIQKLKEYREALITTAVTGQIDVRKET